MKIKGKYVSDRIEVIADQRVISVCVLAVINVITGQRVISVYVSGCNQTNQWLKSLFVCVWAEINSLS